ncbi:MAG: TatD family hydrolase [Acidimicrobiia bacterium]
MDGWVDSHCHLYMTGDADGAVERAVASGVTWMMVPGVDGDTSARARTLASRHRGVLLWSAGLHPHEASRWEEEEPGIRLLAAEADAIGECGLDYYRDLSPREVQRSAFRAQLALAAELAKPVIVHCRDAFADVYSALEDIDLGRKAVLHCWTGGPKWTRRFSELGVTFSFAGPVTYPTGDTVRRSVAVAPRERTLVETDTPFLTPPPHRDAPNEPANVVRIGAAVAKVWGAPVPDVARSSSAAAAAAFGTPAS